MRIRFAFLILAGLLGSTAKASTLRFQPTLEVWSCPPGAVYLVLECKTVAQQEMPAVTLRLQAATDTDPAFVADWSETVTAANTPAAYFYLSILRYHYENGAPFVMLDANSGWDAESARNGGLFLETSPAALPPSLMITGDRHRVGDHEIVTDFQLSDLTFTEDTN